MLVILGTLLIVNTVWQAAGAIVARIEAIMQQNK
jgi:hypothetical protein